MKLEPVNYDYMDLSKRESLDQVERSVADYIAQCIRDDEVDCPVGLFIWKVCEENGVDPHKIAKHLGRRKRREVKTKGHNSRA